MRILLAEDTLDTKRLWEWFLTNAGHEVHCVDNGALAVQTAANAVYDVIVLDIGMPVMNGWDVLHRIRLWPQARHIPVIMVSAYQQTLWEERLEKERLEKAGANKLLYKPILPQDLLKAIEEVELVARQSRGIVP